MGQYHDRRFPGESPEYRTARDRLLGAEMELRRKIEEVAALRRKLPGGGAVEEDYVFEEVNAKSGEVKDVRFSQLFENGDSLVVYGFMYGPDWDEPCPMCTSITDTANGTARHLRAATNHVVVAKAPPEKLLRLAQKRGWNDLRLLSAFGNRFNEDYYAHYEGEYGNHHPMINVFTQRNGRIEHFWASELFFVPEPDMHPRHADLIWPLWNYLDLTPEGRADFMPKLEY